jgi:hypothetical protein
MAKVQSPVAAGVFAAMAIVSGAVAVWSGIVLFRGEPADPVLRALPAGCGSLVVSEQPREAAALWRTLATVGLPAAGSSTLAAWAADAQALASLPQLDGARPAAVCRKDGQSLAVLPGSAATAAAWLARDAHGRSATSAHEAVDAGVRLAWTPTATVGLLAEVRRGVERQPAHKDEALREALERVGGGVEHRFAGPAELAQWAARWPEAQTLLGFVRWAATSLRRDEAGIRLHAHLGMADAGAGWLKPRLDVTQPVDLSPFLASSTLAIAIVRVHPSGFVQAGDVPGLAALEAWSRRWLGQPLATVLAGSSGQLMFQVLDGPERDGQPPWLLLVHKSGRDFAIYARDEALKATAGQLLAQARSGAQTNDDRQRLLQQTSGVWLAAGARLGPLSGPLQIDGMWLDTGVVAELRRPPR